MIELISARGTKLEIYIEPPSKFAIAHQQQLLPSWQVPIVNVILVLQQSRLSLKSTNPDIIGEKNYLREQFWRWGCQFVFNLRDANYPSDIFDPRTGYPWLSPPGEITLNDNAMVAALLNFPTTSYKNCSLLAHPRWQYAVYPSTIVTNAPTEAIDPILQQHLASYGKN